MCKSSVQATSITASFNATNASPEIHPGRYLRREIHPRTNVWEKRSQQEEGWAHLFLRKKIWWQGHKKKVVLTYFQVLLILWPLPPQSSFWSWVPGHITCYITPLAHTLGRMVLTHTLNIKCSPLLGKVAPPVDHRPTHLPITRAGEGEGEVEQCELVPVADTLVSSAMVIRVKWQFWNNWNMNLKKAWGHIQPQERRIKGICEYETIVVWVWDPCQGEQAKGSLMGKQVSEHG